MKANDFNPLFIAPTFMFLAILCFAISAICLIAAYYLTPSYIVVSFLFFLFGFAAGRYSKITLKESSQN